MASFLGQKDVEQCAVAVVHAAMLFLLKGYLPQLAGTSSTFKSHVYEWLQVLHVFELRYALQSCFETEQVHASFLLNIATACGCTGAADPATRHREGSPKGAQHSLEISCNP